MIHIAGKSASGTLKSVGVYPRNMRSCFSFK